VKHCLDVSMPLLPSSLRHRRCCWTSNAAAAASALQSQRRTFLTRAASAAQADKAGTICDLARAGGLHVAVGAAEAAVADALASSPGAAEAGRRCLERAYTRLGGDPTAVSASRFGDYASTLTAASDSGSSSDGSNGSARGGGAATAVAGSGGVGTSVGSSAALRADRTDARGSSANANASSDASGTNAAWPQECVQLANLMERCSPVVFAEVKKLLELPSATAGVLVALQAHRVAHCISFKRALLDALRGSGELGARHLTWLLEAMLTESDPRILRGEILHFQLGRLSQVRRKDPMRRSHAGC
jgi:hypothetical protein